MAHPFTRHEGSPMLALVWGPGLAPVMSALIIERPDLARRLVLAPRRFIHAIAAYVHHALEVQHEPARIAQEIEEEEVRALLSRAISNPHSRFYKVLDRVGPAVLDLDFYRRLNTALRGPAADVLLVADEVTDHLLGMVTEIVADPVLRAARLAIGSSRSDLQHLQYALAYLRAKQLAIDIEALPPGFGWKAVLRRISSDLGRARAPASSFEVPAGWRLVVCVADLWSIGTALGNCVASLSSGGSGYVEQLINGEAVYLTHNEEPAMLACVQNVGPNLWILAETGGSGTGEDILEARHALRAGLINSLAKTGGALLERSPMSSMQSIARRTQGTTENLDDLEEAA